MKRFSLLLLILVTGVVAYASLPLTTVAVLTLTLVDQTNRKITNDAEAIYLDGNQVPIVSIKFQSPSSWDNNLHWWSHSHHPTSTLRPESAKQAVWVEITAKDCETVRLPVSLARIYEPPSIMPHGGGTAYFIYSFEKTVVLQCSLPKS